METKYCHKCEEDRLITQFEYVYRNGKKTDRKRSVCQRCRRKGRGTTRSINRKKRLIDLCGGRCVRCSGVFPYFVYDFHHRDDMSKDFTISAIIRTKWDVILKEIAKCDLLCSNCHRIVHYQGTSQSGEAE